MRYIKIVLDTAYCGTKEERYIETNMTDKELNDIVADEAFNHAENYAYMVYGFGETAEEYAEGCGISIEEAIEELELYYEDSAANSYWEEVTKEEYEENKE